MPKNLRKAGKFSYSTKGKVAVDKNDRNLSFKRATSKLDKVDKVASIAQKTTGAINNMIKIAPYAKLGFEAMKALMNDPKWYLNYPNLTDSGEGLQFTMPNGIADSRSEYAYALGTAPYSADNSWSVPSVCAVRLVLTLGDFENRQNALNRIYNALRRVNTGSIPYDTLDIDEFLYSFRTILALHSYGRRAYGCITKNTVYDVNKPIDYFAAMGLDYDSFRANSAQLRNELNLIADTMKVYAPYSLDVFKRTAWLFDNIYATSDGVKDQEYLFTLWSKMFAYSYQSQKGIIVTVTKEPDSTTTGQLYAGFIGILQTVVSTFVAEPKNAIIAGDMAKAFGVDQMHLLPYTEENYVAPTVYDTAALLQIQNAVMTGVNVSTADKLEPNTAGTMLTEHLESGAAGSVAAYPPKVPFTAYLNLPYDAISRADILEFSRFSCYMHNDGTVHQYGTEIVRSVIIPVHDANSTNAYHINNDCYFGDYNSINMTPTYWNGQQLIMLQAASNTFDYLPKYRMNLTWRDVNSNTNECWTSWIYNWSNWAAMTEQEVKSINNVACSSLYYVPLLIKERKDVLAVD